MAADQVNNQNLQGKSAQPLGMKKDIHKSALKEGEYSHMKNGITSSKDGDYPFMQNAPSNEFCCSLPEGYINIGNCYILEKNFHVLFLAHTDNGSSEIGYFYPETCTYETKLNDSDWDDKCFNFNTNYPIKSQYKYFKCDLNIYFQDGYNRDRYINLDKPPYVKILVDNCFIDGPDFDCSSINIQNDLIPPVVSPVSIEEAGALYTGSYQFAVCYANINGNAMSSYYSNTNIVPIYEDRFGAYKSIEGSSANIPTDKSIKVAFTNIDKRYGYINLAVIKTVQGSPAYELVATLPISTTEYVYTGRETTKNLSFDEVIGLYPDYYNSKSITSANNYLIRANLSTEDESNLQPLANLLELKWVAGVMKAEQYESSYKNPLNTTNKLGYMSGEVYAFGVRFLFSNGRKSAVFHIPGRKANSNDLIVYSRDSVPEELVCDLFEFTDDSCDADSPSALYKWQVYDTATVEQVPSADVYDECFDGVVASGDFAYWESTDAYPCASAVWGDLAGQPIRHHKFPANETFHIHNQPSYVYAATGESLAYYASDCYIYPKGVMLKQQIDDYIAAAVTAGIITQREADLIAGYEIVRGDRTNNKSVIAKGLIYNMRWYSQRNPLTGVEDEFKYPNYPYNDLRFDPFLDPFGNVFCSDPVYLDTASGVPFTFAAGDHLTELTAPSDWLWGAGELAGSGADFVFDQPFSNQPGQPGYVGVDNFYIEYCLTFGLIRKISFYPLGNEEDNPDAFDHFTLSDGIETPVTSANYLKSDFTFHSPDTHFRQPTLGTYLKNHVLEYGAIKGWFEPVQGHPGLRPSAKKSSISMNMAIAFKSESTYNNWLPVDDGQRRRRLVDSGYLPANELTQFDSDAILNQKINNYFRESSVGIKLDCVIEDPVVIDQSRYTMSGRPQPGVDKFHCQCRTITASQKKNKNVSFEIDPECSEDYKWISSYYTSLNTKIPNQYGQVDTVRYISTGKFNPRTKDEFGSPIDERTAIYGGDIFVSKFAFRTHHAFFRVNYIGQSAVGIDYRNKESGDKVRYFVVNVKNGVFDLKAYVIDSGKSILDCSMDPGKMQNGWFYLYSNGIPSFFVESTINTELRYSGSNIWQTWWPKLKGTTVNNWLEEIFSPAIYDNAYLYNFNYSKQNTESSLFPQAADFTPNTKCKNDHPGRIIYSRQSNNEESADSWLVTLANNYYDADSFLGAIIDIEAIDQFRVLVRYENGLQLFNAFDTLQLEQSSVTLGTGGMFQQRPTTFAETDTGYAGTRSKFAIDVCPFGVFIVDNDRRKVFKYDSQLSEISNEGMYNWFFNNMSLKFNELIDQLALLYPDQAKLFNRDNPFVHTGFTSIFDNRYNLWFLTKKDYILVDPQADFNQLSFAEDGNLLYNGELVDFSNTAVWQDVGWTISYSPLFKGWVGFHDFRPNFYLEERTGFFSGRSANSSRTGYNDIWHHWSNTNFQQYYGEIKPWEVTLTTSDEGQTSILHSIEYNLKIQNYLGGYAQDIFENQEINFNRAIVSTDNQCSGLLNLIKKTGKNPFHELKYPTPTPAINPTSVNILYSKVEGHKYRINQFIDIVKDKENGVALFNIGLNGVDRNINDLSIDYNKIKDMSLGNQKFRNEFFDVTLIQDTETDYKFILKSVLNKTLKSIR